MDPGCGDHNNKKNSVSKNKNESQTTLNKCITKINIVITIK